VTAVRREARFERPVVVGAESTRFVDDDPAAILIRERHAGAAHVNDLDLEIVDRAFRDGEEPEAIAALGFPLHQCGGPSFVHRRRDTRQQAEARRGTTRETEAEHVDMRDRRGDEAGVAIGPERP
jgi:hypothetical protein